MNMINFINPVPPEQQREFKIWAHISAFIITVTILLLLYFLAPRIFKLHKLKQEHATLLPDTAQYEQQEQQIKTLKKTHQALNTQAAEIQQYAHGLTNTRKQLLTIIKQVGTTMQLQELTLQNNQTTITAYCRNTQDATNLAQQLSTHPSFSALQITSLQPTPQGAPGAFLVTMQGNLTTQP